MNGEQYLKLAPDGLRRLQAGTQFFVASPDPEADEGAERLVPCAVTRVGGTDQRPLVHLDLAGSREAAIALVGLELLAAGEELEADPHYRVGDLLGLPVETAGGRRLGEVEQVLESPAHEVLQVRRPEGPPLLLPLVDAVVSVDGGILRVVDGFLDE